MGGMPICLDSMAVSIGKMMIEWIHMAYLSTKKKDRCHE